MSAEGEDVLVDGVVPDPRGIGDLAEFIAALDRLRIAGGGVTLRELAQRTGSLLQPPRTVSLSTIGDVFNVNRRRLDFDLVTAVLRALGVAGEDLDQWQSAFARAHANNRSGGGAGVFRQLPADLATFTGRTEELARLLAAVRVPGDVPHTVVVSAIEGMAGVGKTQLAVHAAHELLRGGQYADLQLYVDLRGFDPDRPPADPAVVLDAFLRQLGVAPQRIPAALDERAAMFRDRMHGREALVLLDNAADEKQVRDLIPASAGCLVLVTSRRTLADLDGATLHTLDVFGPDEALDLLARIVGDARVRAEPEAARDLVAGCGHLPLAVSLVAARLRSRPAWSLRGMVDRLGGSLEEVATAGRSLQRVFDLSYENLPMQARELFRLLGTHPGPDFTAASAGALAGVGADRAEQLLELLLDENLVQQRVEGRFQLHDLLKRYAAERFDAEVTDRDRAGALGRLADWLLTCADVALRAAWPGRGFPPAQHTPATEDVPELDGPEPATAWFDREAATLGEAAALARRHGLTSAAGRLFTVMIPMALDRMLLAESERLCRLALEATRAAGDREGEAWVLGALAFTQGWLDQFDEAVANQREALRLYESLGDRGNQSHCYSQLAWILARAGQPEDGLASAQRAVSLSAGASNRIQLQALNGVAFAQHALDQPAAALESLLAGVDRLDSLAEPNFVALWMRNLAYTYLVLKRPDEALESLAAASVTYQSLGNLFCEAECLVGRAQAHLLRGEREQAAALEKQASEMFDHLPEDQAEWFRGRLRNTTLRVVKEHS